MCTPSLSVDASSSWVVVELAASGLEQRGAAIVRGDLLDPEPLVRGMEGCRTVYHVAGVNQLCAEIDTRALPAGRHRTLAKLVAQMGEGEPRQP